MLAALTMRRWVIFSFVLPWLWLAMLAGPVPGATTSDYGGMIPAPQSERVTNSQLSGLVGAWYGNPDFTRPKGSDLLQTMSPRFDSETGYGSSWSAMWEGELSSPTSGLVTLRVDTVGGVIVKIANTNLLDSNSGRTNGTLQMVADRLYPIQVFYSHQNESAGGFRLEWSWPGPGPELIPNDYLSHTAAQEAYWNWRPEPAVVPVEGKLLPRSAGRHVLVYGEPGRFAAWPANNGLWSWGNEILVAFSLGYHKRSSGGGHAVDQTKPQLTAFARSLDGGESWRIEQPTLPTDQAAPENALQTPINFAHTDFAMRCAGGSFIISYDRGRTWLGRYSFSKFPTGRLTSRTDYLVSGSNTCTVFLSAEERGVQVDEYSDRAFCARTTDAGRSWRFLGWMTGEPIGVRSVMPATARTSDSHFVSALRRRIDHGLGGQRPPITENWIDVYESRDSGTNWAFLSRVGDTDRGRHNGNPPALVRLRDGRLVAAYGYRALPYGIRARISNDNGATWSPATYLRVDGGTWDLGYCRMLQRPDGKLVTVYYYNTPDTIEQHIAATIWDPDALAPPAAPGEGTK